MYGTYYSLAFNIFGIVSTLILAKVFDMKIPKTNTSFPAYLC